MEMKKMAVGFVQYIHARLMLTPGQLKIEE
jgi:hypothetical protein